MRLSAILERAGLDAGGAADAPVTGFAIDHRKVAPGTVFGAFQGASVNTTPQGLRIAIERAPGRSEGITSPVTCVRVLPPTVRPTLKLVIVPLPRISSVGWPAPSDTT